MEEVDRRPVRMRFQPPPRALDPRVTSFRLLVPRNANSTSTADPCPSKIASCNTRAWPNCYKGGDIQACVCSTTGNWAQWTGCVGECAPNVVPLTQYCGGSHTGPVSGEYAPDITPTTNPTYKPPPVTTDSQGHTTAVTPDFVKVTTTYKGTAIESIPHDPVPTFTPGASILQGYCSAPQYQLLDAGQLVYWAPVQGCAQDKPDCCPFPIQTSRGGDVLTVPITGSAPTTSLIDPAAVLPFATNNAQSTLDKCPDDYYSTSGGCCPSGYGLWTGVLGGQIPCFSTSSFPHTPPPIPVTVTTTESTKPTSAVINIVYAVQYPVKSSSGGLSTGAKAGIGAASGVVALSIFSLLLLLLLKHKQGKKLRAENRAQRAEIDHMAVSQPIGMAQTEPTLPVVSQPAFNDSAYRGVPVVPAPAPAKYGQSRVEYQSVAANEYEYERQQTNPSPLSGGAYYANLAQQQDEYKNDFESPQFRGVSPPVELQGQDATQGPTQWVQPRDEQLGGPGGGYQHAGAEQQPMMHASELHGSGVPGDRHQ